MGSAGSASAGNFMSIYEHLQCWNIFNSVYKQASIERNSVRKSAAQATSANIADIMQFKKENITPEQLIQFDGLILQ